VCHQQQSVQFGFFGGHRQIDEDAREIKQPGEPAGDKNDMKRFNPQHVDFLFD
jgi:hypothetical protein